MTLPNESSPLLDHSQESQRSDDMFQQAPQTEFGDEKTPDRASQATGSPKEADRDAYPAVNPTDPPPSLECGVKEEAPSSSDTTVDEKPFGFEVPAHPYRAAFINLLIRGIATVIIASTAGLDVEDCHSNGFWPHFGLALIAVGTAEALVLPIVWVLIRRLNSFSEWGQKFAKIFIYVVLDWPPMWWFTIVFAVSGWWDAHRCEAKAGNA